MDWRFLYRGLRARHRDQRLELDALVHALSPADIAVDVGANKGSYLWSLSRAVGHGRVVAFEPQPVLAAYLTRACQDSGLRNVVVEAKGVSAQAGVLTLAIPGDGESSPGASFEAAAAGAEPGRRVDVPVVTLDDYFAAETGRIGAIKIDVEGHEFAVLTGAVRVIEKHRPTLVLECEQRHLAGRTVAEVLGFLTSRGYAGQFIKRGRLCPLEQFDVSVHQRQVGERFWDAPDYCNNFVFTPT